jgi:DNA adenine methylase
VLLRYPGAKSRGALKTAILERLIGYLASNRYTEFREPFFGSGAIGLALIEHGVRHVWFNDLDPGIASLWHAVFNDSVRLEALISDFAPSVEAFHSYKSELLNLSDNEDPVLIGFKKLALNRISFSGMGVMAGGPLGGNEQTSAYGIGCRWSAERLITDIRKIKKMIADVELREGTCTHLDFEAVIRAQGSALIYLDPPYFEKGTELYQFGFAGEHERLAACLRECEHDFVLSYDDCPEVRSLYRWANCAAVATRYSISGQTKKGELVITRGRGGGAPEQADD